MQIKPRAMSRTQNSKAKTATGLHSFTFAATSMDKSKCLEETNFAWTYKSKYAAIFENMRHFVLVPSPPMKMISFFQTFILLVYMIVFERILTHTCESLPPPPPPAPPRGSGLVSVFASMKNTGEHGNLIIRSGVQSEKERPL